MFWVEREVAMVTQIITLFNRGEQKSISEWEPWKERKRKGERGDQGVRDRKVMLSYNAYNACYVSGNLFHMEGSHAEKGLDGMWHVFGIAQEACRQNPLLFSRLHLSWQEMTLM